MDELLQKIRIKRDRVHTFVVRQGPRNKWLLNIAIICGVAGTAFAGIPAIGGASAIDGIKAVTQPQLPVWQFLCIGAALSTMAATVATSLRSNHDTGNKLARRRCARQSLKCWNWCY